MTVLHPPARAEPFDDAALLRVLLQAAPVGYACYDSEGRYLHINEAFAAGSGATAEEHVGRTVREMSPELAEPIEQLIAQVFATAAPVLAVPLGARWTTDWHPVPSPATGACVGVAVIATEPRGAGEVASSLRQTAMSLQRALLPTDVPSTDEIEVAARYVAGASGTEAGGDWYDVIELGAGRLAVVIGDVMGRGVHATAVMGQLRTAARTCARLDLPPAEVLHVLDGLLCDAGDDAIATCIYGAFDPHTREVRLASAGHLPPILRTADGTAAPLDLEVSAPLGLGDPPRESSVRLHPGSLLALYTDGLVEARGSELEEGIAALCRVIGRGPEQPEELADEVLVRLSGGRDADDIALLLVRVRDDIDSRSRTVVLEVPRERALLVDVRSQARQAMASWMLLEDVVHTATLLASELATNALVHGHGRVELRLRLTRDRLVLESVDSGHHMPRRRHAGDEDELGRGLHLVATLADRWGFRATDEGKVVWAELDLA